LNFTPLDRPSAHSSRTFTTTKVPSKLHIVSSSERPKQREGWSAKGRLVVFFLDASKTSRKNSPSCSCWLSSIGTAEVSRLGFFDEGEDLTPSRMGTFEGRKEGVRVHVVEEEEVGERGRFRASG